METTVYSFNLEFQDIAQLQHRKGANLAEMSRSVPVPLQFTITAEACRRFYDDNETISQGDGCCP